MAEQGNFDCYKSPTQTTAAGKDRRKSAQGSLTGPQRKLKDMAAELHNSLEKWETLHATGNTILNEIVNDKLQCIYLQDDGNEPEEKHTSIKALSQKIEPKRQALFITIESMEEVVKKLLSMQSVVHGLRAVCEHRGDSEEVLFSSWTIHQFADTLEALQAMYSKELSLKKELSQNVVYADTRTLLMFYSAAWLHQPYLDSSRMVAAVLRETGHTS